MSTLSTLSVFYYGTTVDRDNNKIDFDEGGSELTATLRIGDYSLTEYVSELQTQFNLVSGNTITVTLNRTTRKITIASTGTLNLLCNTGSHFGTSAYSMMGFNTDADKTGSSSYVSDNGTGSEYRPQSILAQYTGWTDYKVKENAVVNVSTSGIVQAITFGTGSRVRMNITQIRNHTGLVSPLFYENASGLADARLFMDFLITKGKVEFMPDVSSRSTYKKLILENTDVSANGTGYELKNMSKDIYETGKMLFREDLS